MATVRTFLLMAGLYPGSRALHAQGRIPRVGTARAHPCQEAPCPTPTQSTDAIVLLKADHKEIRKTFADFEKAGDGAEKTKQRLVDKMIELLTVHTYIENEVMYPRVRALLPDLEDDILESYEEHHVADVLVMELSAMSAVRRALHGQDHRPHRERHPPHRGGGGGLVPRGAQGSRTQAAAGDRRRDGQGEEEGSPQALSAERAEEDHRRGHRLTAAGGSSDRGRAGAAREVGRELGDLLAAPRGDVPAGEHGLAELRPRLPAVLLDLGGSARTSSAEVAMNTGHISFSSTPLSISAV